ncbi:MAG: agmatine deiminase family protein [Chromatiales bacterium]
MKTENRFRAEWEPQTAVLLTWPHGDSDWAGSLDRISATYLEMARAISRHQWLIILAHDRLLQEQLSSLLADSPHIQIVHQPSNDTWIRDYGPLSIEIRKHVTHLNFRFDAWGGKYDARLDDTVSRALDEQGLFGCGMLHESMVLEGGAVETDGCGTLLATRGSILCERRNPGMDQSRIEEQLSGLLGIKHFLWLDCDGLHGDDTDGHIDTIVRFADAETLLYATCSTKHPDYEQLRELEQQVVALRRPDGRPYRTISLPCPGLHRDSDGRILPASYANFLITNSQVLQPVYGQQNDVEVMQIMQQAFPGREIVAIDSRALIEQNGSIHCATMQTACPLARG